MARLNQKISILVALLSSSMLAASMLASLVAAAAGVEAPSPSPEEIKIAIPPEPEPGFYHFLEVCTKKISPKCGENVFRSVFENVETSRICCCELVYQMGKTCHDDLLKFFVSLPELRLNASQVYSKGKQVWNSCSNIIV